MGTDALHRSVRNTLGRLARARMDNDVFRWEAAEVLRRAIGFDTWCWVLLDPATGLPTRYTATNPALMTCAPGTSEATSSLPPISS